MTSLLTTRQSAPRRSSRSLARTILDAVLGWQDRSRARATLSRLDTHMLRDIGLSLSDAEHEISKPFWRA